MHWAPAYLVSEISPVLLCQAHRKHHFPSFLALHLPNMGEQFKALWGDWRVGGEQQSGYFYTWLSWLWSPLQVGWLLCNSRFWRWPFLWDLVAPPSPFVPLAKRIQWPFSHPWSLACFNVPIWLLSSSNTHATNSCTKFLFEIPGKVSIF